MKEIPADLIGKLLSRAKLFNDAVVPIYFTAAIMEAAEATPSEIVKYLEEHYMVKKEVS